MDLRKLKKLIDLVEESGIAELEITEGGKGLSGGQRQLVGLTRLLLAQPSMMLLEVPSRISAIRFVALLVCHQQMTPRVSRVVGI